MSAPAPKTPATPVPAPRPALRVRSNLQAGSSQLFDSQNNISSDDCGPTGEIVEE